MLEDWARTKKAPKDAAWMHDGRCKEMVKRNARASSKAGATVRSSSSTAT